MKLLLLFVLLAAWVVADFVVPGFPNNSVQMSPVTHTVANQTTGTVFIFQSGECAGTISYCACYPFMNVPSFDPANFALSMDMSGRHCVCNGKYQGQGIGPVAYFQLSAVCSN
jgi:hypothetical protein